MSAGAYRSDNMQANQRIPPGGHSSFYPVGTEVKAGYLYKSPPAKLKWPNIEKSWKRRFFVLFKISEQEHRLKYFRNADDRDRLLGEIDLSQIMRLYISPENHPKWNWVVKNFKCSPACVLFIKTATRDYFLIGENSSVISEWFSDLFDALKYRPHRVFDTEESSDTRLGPVKNKADSMKLRSVSDPPPSMRCRSTSEPGQGSDYPRRPYSEPSEPLYDYPRSDLKKLCRKEVSDDETSSISEDNYEKMEAVYEDIKLWERGTQMDIEVIELNDGGSLVKSVTKVYDRLKTQMSTERLSAGQSDDRKEDFLADNGCCMENGAVSPVEKSKHKGQSSIDSIEDTAPKEKDIVVNRADLKKHLTLTETDGKPCVSGWTGQPWGLFHNGDQILAINDLHTGSVDEFHNYLSKLLKNDVKLTILRLPG